MESSFTSFLLRISIIKPYIKSPMLLTDKMTWLIFNRNYLRAESSSPCASQSTSLVGGDGGGVSAMTREHTPRTHTITHLMIPSFHMYLSILPPGYLERKCWWPQVLIDHFRVHVNSPKAQSVGQRHHCWHHLLSCFHTVWQQLQQLCPSQIVIEYFQEESRIKRKTKKKRGEEKQ